jgi:hypothetical protein
MGFSAHEFIAVRMGSLTWPITSNPRLDHWLLCLELQLLRIPGMLHPILDRVCQQYFQLSFLPIAGFKFHRQLFNLAGQPEVLHPIALYSERVAMFPIPPISVAECDDEVPNTNPSTVDAFVTQETPKQLLTL